MVRSRIQGVVILIVSAAFAAAQSPSQAPTPPGWTPATAQHPSRPPMPTRDPHTPGYVAAKELPDGTVPLRMRMETSSSGLPTMPHPRCWPITVCKAP